MELSEEQIRDINKIIPSSYQVVPVSEALRRLPKKRTRLISAPPPRKQKKGSTPKLTQIDKNNIWILNTLKTIKNLTPFTFNFTLIESRLSLRLYDYIYEFATDIRFLLNDSFKSYAPEQEEFSQILHVAMAFEDIIKPHEFKPLREQQRDPTAIQKNMRDTTKKLNFLKKIKAGSELVIRSDPLTSDEKSQLGQDILKLNAEELAKVANIVADSDEDPEELNLEIESLHPVTARKLYQYVRQCMKHKGTGMPLEQLQEVHQKVSQQLQELDTEINRQQIEGAIQKLKEDGKMHSESESSESSSEGEEIPPMIQTNQVNVEEMWRKFIVN